MGCQTAIAQQIINQGGTYVLAAKANQNNLYTDIKILFTQTLDDSFYDIEHQSHIETDGGHGRVDKRTYYIVKDDPKNSFDPSNKWGLKAVGIVMRESTDHAGNISCDTRYYIISEYLSAQEFARSVRKHWGIENSLHYILDVSFREDHSMIKNDNGAFNFSVLRRVAATLLKNENTCKRGIKGKRLKCAWDKTYLMLVLNI